MSRTLLDRKRRLLEQEMHRDPLDLQATNALLRQVFKGVAIDYRAGRLGLSGGTVA